jgi:hypothetical protein
VRRIVIAKPLDLTQKRSGNAVRGRFSHSSPSCARPKTAARHFPPARASDDTAAEDEAGNPRWGGAC